jgi:hypothetical protein
MVNTLAAGLASAAPWRRAWGVVTPQDNSIGAGARPSKFLAHRHRGPALCSKGMKAFRCRRRASIRGMNDKATSAIN